MGSRIMLHLREQGRKGHLVGSISGLDSFYSSSTFSCNIRLRNLATHPPVSRGVVLEQTSVVHDDQGQVLDSEGAGPSKLPHAADPDWHESTTPCQPQAVELTEGRKSENRDSGFSSS